MMASRRVCPSVDSLIPRRQKQRLASSAAEQAARSGAAAPFACLNWLALLIGELLSTGDQVILARCDIAQSLAVRRSWRRSLLARGFSPRCAACVVPAIAASLERWGGQSWDAWWQRGPGSSSFLFRHWRCGTSILLSEGSNGLFDFVIAVGGRPHMFYSGGTWEVVENSGDLDRHLTAVERLNGSAGTRLLVQVPCDNMSCWQFKLDSKGGMAVLHAAPGALGLQQRLRLTAGGFWAFGDNAPSQSVVTPAFAARYGGVALSSQTATVVSDVKPVLPCLVVEEGSVVFPLQATDDCDGFSCR
eukprot:TRINITY_DN21211_c0_g2_i1.p1 TRINITY_DN21211_c0_g2~~TRINITY_DN21211_c0_g2_i1.p1  ORF type:complete len:353 (+),score=42.05 TRINITY_DN21211_c0_g2_i1:152-1060(+)